MSQKQYFRRKALAACVSGALGAWVLPAAGQTEPALEEVIVTGVRAAQETAVNIKRDAISVMDAISAEDIGKLPDVTIADSLQRVSGVQIRRSAGEGAAVNVRGLPQVVTQLNGEQYLGANSVVSTQPDFGNMPSQLFKGAEVYKSAPANIGNAGITGTVNLKTYRPFDFDEGLTTAGSVEAQYGTETEEVDPVLSGLINWKSDRFGFLFAATYANVNLSNSYNGINTGDPGDAGWTSRIYDSNLVGAGVPGAQDQNRVYMGSQGFSAWNQITERERVGINSSLQLDLGEGFTLTADLFYAQQDEYNRKIGLSATNKWQTDNWFLPSNVRDTGFAAGQGEGSFHTWSQAELYPHRLKSFTQNDVYDTSSRNLNVQLDYDNGGAFTGSFRAVIGDASRQKRHGYNEGDLTDGTTTGINPLAWSVEDDPDAEGYTPPGERQPPGFYPAELCRDDAVFIGSDGGCFQTINPLGYSERPHITYDTSGSHPTWSGFDRQLAGGLGEGATVADYMANLDSYNVGAFSSENNEDSDGSLNAFSLKGSYAFTDGFITSVDFGARAAQRSASFERFNYLSPLYEEGCDVQWKATDVQLHTGGCQAGEVVNGNLNGFDITDSFVGYTAIPNIGLDEYTDAVWVTDFGPVKGIPGVWAVDPKEYDDPVAFHTRVFGGVNKYVVPGSSFDVDMDELSYYAQANFGFGPVTGNLGVRVVETDLTVKQNIAGDQRPYSNVNDDAGDVVTKRDYTDVLPALNLAWNITDDLIARFAYTEAMTPLDLNNYGEGLALNYTIDNTDPSSPTYGDFIVSGGSLSGNPELDPWRSQNYDLSLEWYVGPASLLNVALFRVEIDSFVEGTEERMAMPDADGVVRREVIINTLAQGDGGTLEGVELGVKLAFGDFTSGVLADFGADANYTWSPSEAESTDIRGDKNMFPDNSEHQFNLATWYESGPFQARIAYNYRSERLAGTGAGGWGALNLYQEAAAYVDVSVSYDVTDEITLYLNGSNVTGEYEDYYLEFDDQFAFQNYYEPRYALGVRARF